MFCVGYTAYADGKECASAISTRVPIVRTSHGLQPEIASRRLGNAHVEASGAVGSTKLLFLMLGSGSRCWQLVVRGSANDCTRADHRPAARRCDMERPMAAIFMADVLGYGRPWVLPQFHWRPFYGRARSRLRSSSSPRSP